MASFLPSLTAVLLKGPQKFIEIMVDWKPIILLSSFDSSLMVVGLRDQEKLTEQSWIISRVVILDIHGSARYIFSYTLMHSLSHYLTCLFRGVCTWRPNRALGPPNF